MHSKVLVPMDKSEEAEKVLPLIKSLMTSGGEIILLHIIQISQEVERLRAMDYLEGVAKGLKGDARRCSCEVFISDSIAEGITQVAIEKEVDLIAMYTHDRKGLAKLIKDGIAEKVRREAPIEVQVFKPRELVGSAAP